MANKLSYSEVFTRLKENGVTLITKTYINSNQKLDYKCDVCGEQDSTTMQRYKKRKIWCNICNDGSHAKLTHKIIEARFKRRGFLLITPYEGDMSAYLEYTCKCGNIDKMTFQRFRRYPDYGCKECTKKAYEKLCLEKYGEINPFRSKQVKDKRKETNLEKYGHENTFQVPEFKEKLKKTNLEKYGVEHPMHVEKFKEKQKLTTMKNHGVDNPMKNPKIRQKASDTCKERYGEDNPMKVDMFYRKANNSYAKKDYILPSGRILKIQGYENHALDLLLQKYDETEIEADSKNIPTIKYTFEGKQCKFHPDIFIPKKNKIIEVKSTYTYGKFKKKNRIKIRETSFQGYKIEYWIFDRRGEIVKMIFVD